MSVFDDFVVEEKTRFESLNFFGREIDLRIEFTPREFQTLMGLLDTMDKQSEKARKTGNEQAQQAYEKAVGDSLAILTRTQEDKEYVKSLVVGIDGETTKFLSLGEFLKIIKLCLKADTDRIAEETKKAEDGESIS